VQRPKAGLTKVLLGLLLTCCLGFLLTPLQSAEARVRVSEDWLRIYQGSPDYAGAPWISPNAMAVTADKWGNSYVAGQIFYALPIEEYENAIIKYSPAGEQLWVARFRFFYDPPDVSKLPRAIAVDDSGNVYVTGTYTRESGYSGMFIAKFNSNGETVWAHPDFMSPYAGYYQAVGLAVDSSGNVYVTGFGRWLGETGDSMSIIKYGPDGEYLWSQGKGDGASESYESFGLALDSYGNACVTGVRKTPTWEYITLKYHTNGNLWWENTYDAGLNTNPVAIAVDPKDNVYVFGSAMDGIQRKYCTLKYNLKGDLEWERRHDPGAVNLVNPMDMKVDPSENVYATGYADSVHSASYYYTIKYNMAGDLQWTARYAGPGQAPTRAMRLALDSRGNSYVTGTWDNSSSSAIITVSYDSAGVLRWEAKEDGWLPGRPVLPPKGKDLTWTQASATGVAVTSSNHVIVAGSVKSSGTIGANGFLTIKYHQGIRPAKPILMPPFP
jgi:hypothetical protein